VNAAAFEHYNFGWCLRCWPERMKATDRQALAKFSSRRDALRCLYLGSIEIYREPTLTELGNTEAKPQCPTQLNGFAFGRNSNNRKRLSSLSWFCYQYSNHLSLPFWNFDGSCRTCISEEYSYGSSAYQAPPLTANETTRQRERDDESDLLSVVLCPMDRKVDGSAIQWVLWAFNPYGMLLKTGPTGSIRAASVQLRSGKSAYHGTMGIWNEARESCLVVLNAIGPSNWSSYALRNALWTQGASF